MLTIILVTINVHIMYNWCTQMIFYNDTVSNNTCVLKKSWKENMHLYDDIV